MNFIIKILRILRGKCPQCKAPLKDCVVYANFNPCIFCGECGYIFEGKREEINK